MTPRNTIFSDPYVIICECGYFLPIEDTTVEEWELPPRQRPRRVICLNVECEHRGRVRYVKQLEVELIQDYVIPPTG